MTCFDHARNMHLFRPSLMDFAAKNMCRAFDGGYMSILSTSDPAFFHSQGEVAACALAAALGVGRSTATFQRDGQEVIASRYDAYAWPRSRAGGCTLSAVIRIAMCSSLEQQEVAESANSRTTPTAAIEKFDSRIESPLCGTTANMQSRPVPVTHQRIK